MSLHLISWSLIHSDFLNLQYYQLCRMTYWSGVVQKEHVKISQFSQRTGKFAEVAAVKSPLKQM